MATEKFNLLNRGVNSEQVYTEIGVMEIYWKRLLAPLKGIWNVFRNWIEFSVSEQVWKVSESNKDSKLLMRVFADTLHIWNSQSLSFLN
jgi:hypothetical protein